MPFFFNILPKLESTTGFSMLWKHWNTFNKKYLLINPQVLEPNFSVNALNFLFPIIYAPSIWETNAPLLFNNTPIASGVKSVSANAACISSCDLGSPQIGPVASWARRKKEKTWVRCCAQWMVFVWLEKKDLAKWKGEKGERRKGETGRVFVLRLMLMAVEWLTKNSL